MLLLISCFSCVWLCATLETAAHQAPPSLGFSRQEHWSGLPFPSPMHEGEKWKWSRSVMSNSSKPHGLQPTRLLHPWDLPGKSTGVGCHHLLRTFPISTLKKGLIIVTEASSGLLDPQFYFQNWYGKHDYSYTEFTQYFFFKWTIFKGFIQSVTILFLLLCFGFLVVRHVGSKIPHQGSNPHRLH